MTDTSRVLARNAQILRFLIKYRRAGVLSGVDIDPATSDLDTGDDGKPEAFVDDLEALGPTFIKIGQALSTRPDMVPPAYIAALERMQDDVAPLPFEVIHAGTDAALFAELESAYQRQAPIMLWIYAPHWSQVKYVL